ncbi:MAG: ATP cone domain-containing protein [Kiritimatiellia bacterium]|nr:ATP cone domain-containing protein [Kiritimatiellia bacterium]
MSNTKIPLKLIIKREGNLVPYDRDRIATAVFRAMASIKKANRRLADTISLDVERSLLSCGGQEDSYPSVEEIQDIVEKILLEKDQIETAKAYMAYRSQRAQARSRRENYFEVTDNIPYKKIYEVLRWNINHGCDSIHGLNQIIAEGRLAELVRDSDRRYEDELTRCAQEIASKRGKARVIIVAGPSSSGKTTTTMKLGEKLKKAGLEFKSLVMDNYFFDLEKHPKDEFGDYDYESPHSLDLALINSQLAALLDGHLVKTPLYNFKTGQRTLNVNAMRLEKNQLLLLDSLHGLYHEMTKDVPSSGIFKIYIETLGQLRSADGLFLRWADNRLMRRMIRDQLHRNSQPLTTLTHWHYVRRSELQNIIPFIATADFLVNSALPYEIPILKHKVFACFPKAIEQYRDDPQRQDAYIRAKRMVDFLSPLREVAETDLVPNDSLLREFIGGSKYGC